MNIPIHYPIWSTVNPENTPNTSPNVIDYVTEHKSDKITSKHRIIGMCLLFVGMLIGGVLTLFIALYVRNC